MKTKPEAVDRIKALEKEIQLLIIEKNSREKQNQIQAEEKGIESKVKENKTTIYTT